MLPCAGIKSISGFQRQSSLASLTASTYEWIHSTIICCTNHGMNSVLTEQPWIGILQFSIVTAMPFLALLFMCNHGLHDCLLYRRLLLRGLSDPCHSLPSTTLSYAIHSMFLSSNLERYPLHQTKISSSTAACLEADKADRLSAPLLSASSTIHHAALAFARYANLPFSPISGSPSHVPIFW